MNEETEKKQRNPHLIGKKKIKVQALRDAWFGKQKIIQGQTFEIKERKGVRRVSKYSDYTEPFTDTVANQFSKFWMIELDEEGMSEEDYDNNEAILEAKATADKLRAKDSEASEKSLSNKPVVKKPLKRKVKKPEPVKEPEKASNDEEVI